FGPSQGGAAIWRSDRGLDASGTRPRAPDHVLVGLVGALTGCFYPGHTPALHRRHDYAGRIDAERPIVPPAEAGPGPAEREHAAAGRGPRVVQPRDAVAWVSGRITGGGGLPNRGNGALRVRRANRDRDHRHRGRDARGRDAGPPATGQAPLAAVSARRRGEF